MNAIEIEEAISKLAEQPFDPAEFPYAFLEAFGNKNTTINRLRKGESNKSDIAGAVLQYNNIHMAVCAGGDALKTLERLKSSPATTRQTSGTAKLSRADTKTSPITLGSSCRLQALPP